MAIWIIKQRNELEPYAVLAPERYNPERMSLMTGRLNPKSILLGEVANIVRQIINPSSVLVGRYLVLDTSDAREGLIVSCKKPIMGKDIGSAKKIIKPHDVIISRLRPYLRQVAYIDTRIMNWCDDVTLACSTEFCVLRSLGEQSISFLIPFLLSDPVQSVLAASQEGGHHPRFNESLLSTLPVPLSLIEARGEISCTVENSIALYREAEFKLEGLKTSVSRML